MKKGKEHLGHKLKRIRGLLGISQEELARSIGKTRSLVSHLEITGNINKYTLQEIAEALKIDPETIEKFGSDNIGNIIKDKNANKQATDKLQETISQQREEIKELKATIKEQWKTIQNLSKQVRK